MNIKKTELFPIVSVGAPGRDEALATIWRPATDEEYDLWSEMSLDQRMRLANERRARFDPHNGLQAVKERRIIRQRRNGNV